MTEEEGNCYSEAAGEGSRRRLIRKYKPTSTVASATPAVRRKKKKRKIKLTESQFLTVNERGYHFQVIVSGVMTTLLRDTG